MDTFWDFDQGHENQLEPKYNTQDLLSEENNPILCDNCNDGIRLEPYEQQQGLICPRCLHVYNPAFDTIKHEAIETTIEEMQESHSGTMSYVEDDKKQETRKTKIRKTLSKDDLPQYVKDELENIHWRKGYKTVKPDRNNKLLSNPREK